MVTIEEKLTHLATLKLTMSIIKRYQKTSHRWEEVFAKNIIVMVFVSQICKQKLQINKKKANQYKREGVK